jgi:hypothetical protein
LHVSTTKHNRAQLIPAKLPQGLPQGGRLALPDAAHPGILTPLFHAFFEAQPPFVLPPPANESLATIAFAP